MKIFRVDVNRATGLDYALMCISGSLAVYCLAQSLAVPGCATVMLPILWVGTLVGYFSSKTITNQRGFGIDIAFYVVIAVLCTLIWKNLNSILPGDGIPNDLSHVAAVSWMIILCSFGAWRDMTLLFQSIPGIALFGLVGAFDIYPLTTPLFFIFLTCAGLQFARSHHRNMLRRAINSGYKEVDRIREGPWRWMAGPEWALGSALVVMLLSLFAAPLLREGAQAVRNTVGLVNITLPNTPGGMRGRGGFFTDSYRVGRGPNRSLTEDVVFTTSLSTPEYMRTQVYQSFSGRSWRRASTGTGQDGPSLRREAFTLRNLVSSDAYEDLEYLVRIHSAGLRYLPAVGVLTGVSPSGNWQASGDGTLPILGNALDKTFLIQTRVRRGGLKPNSEELPSWPTYLQTPMASQRMTAFQKNAVADAKTPWEKAIQLKHAIGAAVRYNLEAAEVPPEQDPTEHFLFESKEGYCDLFATAMAILARREGIPSRFVVGFFPSIRHPDGGYKVREADAHAWAELYFPGMGWVPFDATEDAEAAGLRRGESNSLWNLLKSPSFFIPLLVAVAAAGFVIAFGKLRRYRVYSGSYRFQQSRVAKEHERFVKMLERRFGSTKSISETTREYIDRSSRPEDPTASAMIALNNEFEKHLYDNTQITSERVELMAAKVREFKLLLKDQKVA